MVSEIMASKKDMVAFGESKKPAEQLAGEKAEATLNFYSGKGDKTIADFTKRMEDISRRETILKEQNVEGYSLSDVFSPWGRSGISAWLRGKYVWLSNMKNKAGSRFSDAWKMKIEKAFIDDIKKEGRRF